MRRLSLVVLRGRPWTSWNEAAFWSFKDLTVTRRPLTPDSSLFFSLLRILYCHLHRHSFGNILIELHTSRRVMSEDLNSTASQLIGVDFANLYGSIDKFK